MADATHQQAYRRAGRWSRRVFSVFVRADIPDAPNVVHQGPVIVAANHRSFYDIFFAYTLLYAWGLAPRMLVRGSYFKAPVLGWMLKATGCIPVESQRGSEAIDEALEELNADRPVAIMPEGRLVKPQDRPDGVGEARDGIGVLALKSGAPVIVVGIAGAERVWPVGKPVPIPRLRRTNLVVKIRVLDDFEGSATEVRLAIMASLGEAVREAEAAR
jgi:1-acyl-sn-glycerol-3-phosphate acyltransferase